MGKLHNAIVELIDNSKLTPPEVIAVLRLLVRDIEKAFKMATGGGS